MWAPECGVGLRAATRGRGSLSTVNVFPKPWARNVFASNLMLANWLLWTAVGSSVLERILIAHARRSAGFSKKNRPALTDSYRPPLQDQRPSRCDRLNALDIWLKPYV